MICRRLEWSCRRRWLVGFVVRRRRVSGWDVENCSCRFMLVRVVVIGIFRWFLSKKEVMREEVGVKV